MALGSITSLGAGSSLDLQGILDQLREVEEEAALTPLENQKAQVEAQLAEFDVLEAKFLDMKSHALTLSLASSFLERQVTVGDSAVLTATVAAGTTPFTATVEVVRLASRSTFQSDGVSDPDAALVTADSTFAYHLGATGETISLEVAAGTTLNQLAALINDDPNNPGVTATVIDDGTGSTPYRLVLRANDPGEDNRITIDTPLADLAFTEVQGAGTSLNAELKVDGITYERQRNTDLTDVLQGVTLTLQSTGTTTVQVTTDTTGIKTAITELVSTFNDIVQEIRANSGFDEETGTFGPLAAATTIRNLDGELTVLLGSRIETGGTYTSLFDLGLSIDRDGTIRIDEAILDAALASNLEDVQTLFAGDEEAGITGLGELLNDRLLQITKSTGLLAAEKEAAQGELDRLETRIEETQARLDRRFEVLAKQFAALDVLSRQMEQQATFLSNFINSLNPQNA
ncbi:MAG: flagellar hook-associated protein 2 [Candidatus Tectimicrobiota bacterium]|nr:MAG: flagellar hook-associated protein 2 [Candidatus Tectomicrobia bacterium]